MEVLSPPEVDVQLGNSELGESVGIAGCQGMTIKDILDKVDLFNFAMLVDDDDQIMKDKKASLMIPSVVKDDKPKTVISAPKSAFLGPQIWKKPINFHKPKGGDNGGPANKGNTDGTGPQFSVMNIDEFLNENNFDFGRYSPPVAEDVFDERGQRDDNSTFDVDTVRTETNDSGSVTSEGSMMETEQPITASNVIEMPQSHTSAFGMNQTFAGTFAQSSAPRNKPKNGLPKGENGFLYAESKAARIEREKEELRRREEAILDFSAEELALATIPGADFDPTRHQFSSDELRPQPIIRKRRKTYVCTDRKDDKYWEKRGKNNVAARRSREARRLKENQISLRTSFLEQQNASLKAALQIFNEKNEKLILEKKILMEKLKKYESMAPFLDSAVV